MCTAAFRPHSVFYAFMVILTAKKYYFPVQIYLNGILMDSNYILYETQNTLLYRKQNIFRFHCVRRYFNRWDVYVRTGSI